MTPAAYPEADLAMLRANGYPSPETFPPDQFALAVQLCQRDGTAEAEPETQGAVEPGPAPELDAEDYLLPPVEAAVKEDEEDEVVTVPTKADSTPHVESTTRHGRPSPAFQFYPRDWLASTSVALMTLAEQGAYVRLLCHAWNSADCGLPDDDEQLAVLSGMGKEWLKGGSKTLRKCFVLRASRLYNERLLREREKQEFWREKGREGGFKSGEVRRLARSQNKGHSALKGGSSRRSRKSEKTDAGGRDARQKRTHQGGVEPCCLQSNDNKHSVDGDLLSWLDSFWALYPRKVGKAAALKAARSKAKNPEVRAAIIEGLKRQLPGMRSQEPKYIPHPATWINQERWLDEVEATEGNDPGDLPVYRAPWEEGANGAN